MNSAFAAIDFETANSNRASVCAVGIVVMRGGKVASRRSWLVRPPESSANFEWRNVSIHGISASTVRNQPRLKDVWASILLEIGDLDVVAHNASFDMSVFRAATHEIGAKLPNYNYFCTLALSRRLLALPSYRLPDVAKALWLPMGKHHDAAADAEAAARIAQALMLRRAAPDLRALYNVAGISSKKLVAH